MNGTIKPLDASGRLKTIIQRAMDMFGVNEEQIHTGHVILAALYGDSEYILQIDAATDEKQTNLEVADLSTRLADAMNKSGLKPGDRVVIIGPNNISISLPFYACFYNGYAACTIDSKIPERELEALFSNVQPKIVFCSTISEDMVQKSLKANNLTSRIVTFQGPNNLKTFIGEFNGNSKGFRPAIFDQKETIAWLILTSGTTGMSKVAVVPFDTLYKNIKEWGKFIPPFVIEKVFASSSVQWLSTITYFTTSVLSACTRIQTSAEVTLKHVREIINKYKPQAMSFAPFLLRRFLEQEANNCDMSCLKLVSIIGGMTDNEVHLRIKEKTKGMVIVLYAMTETIMSPFLYVPNTPMGSLGLALPFYSYKLVADNGKEIDKPNEVGELWWKGGYFFKEYLNNPEETAQILTPDGWIKTGDLMSRDESNFYYFHERKKLLIKYMSYHVIPTEIEHVIKKNPKVSEVVVVGIPHPDYMEMPAAAILPLDGATIEPREIFELVNSELPEHKRLHGGLYFVENYPLTPAGKINRPALLKQAIVANRHFDQKRKINALIEWFNNLIL